MTTIICSIVQLLTPSTSSGGHIFVVNCVVVRKYLIEKMFFFEKALVAAPLNPNLHETLKGKKTHQPSLQFPSRNIKGKQFFWTIFTTSKMQKSNANKDWIRTKIVCTSEYS